MFVALLMQILSGSVEYNEFLNWSTNCGFLKPFKTCIESCQIVNSFVMSCSPKKEAEILVFLSFWGKKSNLLPIYYYYLKIATALTFTCVDFL